MKAIFPFLSTAPGKSCRRLRFSFSSRFPCLLPTFDRQTNASLFANLRLQPFTPSILQAGKSKACPSRSVSFAPTLLCEWKWKFFFFLSQQIFSKEKEENGKESGCSEFWDYVAWKGDWSLLRKSEFRKFLIFVEILWRLSWYFFKSFANFEELVENFMKLENNA